LKPDRRLWLAAGVLLLVAAWYAVHLDRAGFWLDEVGSVMAVEQGYQAMLANRMDAGHGPVYFSVLWAVQRLAGTSELVLRLPALLFGLGSVVLLYLLLAPRAGRAVAMLAALLLLVNPVQVYMAMLARPYTMASFLCLLLSWRLLRAQEGWGPRDGPVIAVLGLLCIGTHYSTVFVLLGMALYLASARPRQWRSLAALGVGVLLYAPWVLAFLAMKTEPLEQIAWWSPPSVMDVLALPVRLAGLAVREVEPGSAIAIARVAAALGLVALAIRGARRLGWLGRFWVFLWAMPPAFMLLLMLAGVWGNPFIVHHYFSVPIIAQSTLVAAGALGLGRSRAVRALLPTLLVVLLLGVVAALLHTWPYPDWRAVVRHLQSGPVAECRVTVVHKQFLAAEYHLGRSDIAFDRIPLEFGRLNADDIARAARDARPRTPLGPPVRRCLLIPAYLEERLGLPPEEIPERLLGAGYRAAAREEVGRVVVILADAP
jgi:hypothetical protein